MRVLLVTTFLLTLLIGKAQSPMTSNFFNYHLVDRVEIMNGELSPQVFTSVKPYNRLAISNYQFNSSAEISSQDAFNRDYLLTDNSSFNYHISLGYTDPQRGDIENQKISDIALTQRSVFNTFYIRRMALYSVDTWEPGKAKSFLRMDINPVLGFQGGFDQIGNEAIYRNSRGLVIRGSISGKLGFYTYVSENQIRFPKYIRDEVDLSNAVYGTGLFKKFGQNGYDFFNAAGYITFSPIKEIMIQFGHDRNFIGNGYRSLILSDQAKEYPFLKLNTKVWKFNYMNLFMEHIDYAPTPDGDAFRRKFSALHHLSINIGKHLNIGFFENVIFDRQDSTENNRYEINYLNPIIFYRAAEHGLNSSDNVVMGMDWKWNFLKKFSFYGQFVLDEFKKNDFFAFNDSWRNKFGYQIGLKYLNVANISTLDLQLEYNHMRPYSYQHFTKSQNWIHFNQSLAHPLGANFSEFVGIVRYQPINKLFLVVILSNSRQGRDSVNATIHYGGNVLTDYYSRPDEDLAPMFQGLDSRVTMLDFQASYMLFHNLFIDCRVIYRKANGSYYDEAQNNFIFGGGIRLNTAFARL